MNTPHHRPVWIDQATGLLDDAARDLDAATLSKLNQARQKALAQRRGHRTQFWLLPAGLASACVLLLAFGLWHPRGAAVAPPTPALGAIASDSADADAASAEASPEFYQDLEFYAWLDAQNRSDGTED